MEWAKSQAKRVCEACFGGDAAKMREHARRYLQDGHQAVPDLGREFRDIVARQNRHEWWGRALAALDHKAASEAGARRVDHVSVSVFEAIPDAEGADMLNRSSDSSYLAKLAEHLFLGDLLKHAFKKGARIQVMHPEVDDGGVDVVLISGGIDRFVQVKSSSNTAKVAFHKVHDRLAQCRSGCVVWILLDPNLNLRYRFFGGRAGEPLGDLSRFPLAKHSKGNAEGVKSVRRHIRAVPRSQFGPELSVGGIFEVLFQSPS